MFTLGELRDHWNKPVTTYKITKDNQYCGKVTFTQKAAFLYDNTGKCLRYHYLQSKYEPLTIIKELLEEQIPHYNIYQTSNGLATTTFTINSQRQLLVYQLFKEEQRYGSIYFYAEAERAILYDNEGHYVKERRINCTDHLELVKQLLEGFTGTFKVMNGNQYVATINGKRDVAVVCTHIGLNYQNAQYGVLVNGKIIGSLYLTGKEKETLINYTSTRLIQSIHGVYYPAINKSWTWGKSIQTIDVLKEAKIVIQETPTHDEYFACTRVDSWYRDYRAVKDCKYFATMTLFDLQDKTGVFFQTPTDFSCFLEETPWKNTNKLDHQELAKKATEKPRSKANLDIVFNNAQYKTNIWNQDLKLTIINDTVTATYDEDVVKWTRKDVKNVLPLMREAVLRLFFCNINR